MDLFECHASAAPVRLVLMIREHVQGRFVFTQFVMHCSLDGHAAVDQDYQSTRKPNLQACP
eukprot:3564793-Amphidinium_carterae.1